MLVRRGVYSPAAQNGGAVYLVCADTLEKKNKKC
jgi:hypothetical protein